MHVQSVMGITEICVTCKLPDAKPISCNKLFDYNAKLPGPGKQGQ